MVSALVPSSHSGRSWPGLMFRGGLYMSHCCVMSGPMWCGKLTQIAKDLRRYNVSEIGVSERRWNTFGEVTTATAERFLYSGKEREWDLHTKGVGLILSKDAARSLFEWNGNQSLKGSSLLNLHLRAHSHGRHKY